MNEQSPLPNSSHLVSIGLKLKQQQSGGNGSAGLAHVGKMGLMGQAVVGKVGAQAIGVNQARGALGAGLTEPNSQTGPRT